MKKLIKNKIENIHGGVNCIEIHPILGEIDHTMDNSFEYELDESTEWEDVKSLPQAEKDAYKAQQERDAILSELSALDAPTYKIERALAGDQQAIDDIKANEAKKNELRAKL